MNSSARSSNRAHAGGRWLPLALLLPLAAISCADEQAGAFDGGGPDAGPAPLPPAGDWEAAPPLLGERDALSLVIDEAGAVWAFGGRDQAYVPQRTVQRLEPGADQWSWEGALIERRSFYVVFPLDGGETLHVGGFGNGGTLSNAETYGATATSITLHSRRELFSGAALADGRLLVSGGYIGNTNSTSATAEIFADGAFDTVGQMSEPRQGHSSVTLPDGSVLVCGGHAMQVGAALSSCDRFDPVTEKFLAAAPLNVPRYRHTATLLADGSVLVTGGNGPDGLPLDTAELFDPDSASWVLLDSVLADPKMDHTATLLADGSVLIVGGFSAADGGCTVASADGYFPADRTFYRLPDMAHDRHEHGAVRLPDGVVLVVGGMTWPADERLSSVERFVPSAP